MQFWNICILYIDWITHYGFNNSKLNVSNIWYILVANATYQWIMASNPSGYNPRCENWEKFEFHIFLVEKWKQIPRLILLKMPCKWIYYRTTLVCHIKGKIYFLWWSLAIKACQNCLCRTVTAAKRQ